MAPASRINPSTERELIGNRLSHYTILGRLGAGAMGEVYHARDEKLGREVALKILPKEFRLRSSRQAMQCSQ